MQAQRVPSPRGWRWLADGWKIFRSAPVMWLALVFGYWMLMTVVSIVPFVGVIAVLMLVPGFSVAFMAASRVAERAQPIEMKLLFAGFRENVNAQVGLGAVYLVAIAVLLSATTLADDGALARWMLTGARPTAEVMQSDGFLVALMIATTLYAPVMMLFWFAPTLVAWHSMPGAKGAVLFAVRLPHELARLHGLRRGHGARACRGALHRDVRPHGALGRRPAPGRDGGALSVHPFAHADLVRELLRKLSRYFRARGSFASRVAVVCAA